MDGSNIINSGILALQHRSFSPNDLKKSPHREFVSDGRQIVEEREGKEKGGGRIIGWERIGDSSEMPLFFLGDRLKWTWRLICWCHLCHFSLHAAWLIWLLDFFSSDVEAYAKVDPRGLELGWALHHCDPNISAAFSFLYCKTHIFACIDIWAPKGVVGLASTQWNISHLGEGKCSYWSLSLLF